jgi:hypothetical protein
MWVNENTPRNVRIGAEFLQDLLNRTPYDSLRQLLKRIAEEEGYRVAREEAGYRVYEIPREENSPPAPPKWRLALSRAAKLMRSWRNG